MHRYLSRWVVGAIAGLLLSVTAVAQTLYVATMRPQAAAGTSAALVSGLYTVNLATGTATFAAPLRANGLRPIGITGLAVQGTTGVFYGITSTLSPNHPKALFVVDPVSGDASLVGELSSAGSDIVFDHSGTLFMWIPATHQIARVDINTGQVTPLGRPGKEEALGGLAVDAQGVGYVTPSGANGTLDTVDLKTGEFKTGPPLVGAPYPGAITAMTFTPSGLLLAVNSNVGSPAHARLVAINTATGQVANIGTLPDDSDALTFAPVSRDIGQMLSTMSGRTMALLALVLGLILALIGVALVKAMRH
jgi:DNA-binding beta-propeller fold protein YncE